MFPPGMEDAMQEMFGGIVAKAVAEALQPLQQEVAAMRIQIQMANDTVQVVRDKGGMLAKMLGG